VLGVMAAATLFKVEELSLNIIPRSRRAAFFHEPFFPTRKLLVGWLYIVPIYRYTSSVPRTR
jgi:hypothetical protein